MAGFFWRNSSPIAPYTSVCGLRSRYAILILPLTAADGAGSPAPPTPHAATAPPATRAPDPSTTRRRVVPPPHAAISASRFASPIRLSPSLDSPLPGHLRPKLIVLHAMRPGLLARRCRTSYPPLHDNTCRGQVRGNPRAPGARTPARAGSARG